MPRPARLASGYGDAGLGAVADLDGVAGSVKRSGAVVDRLLHIEAGRRDADLPDVAILEGAIVSAVFWSASAKTTTGERPPSSMVTRFALATRPADAPTGSGR